MKLEKCDKTEEKDEKFQIKQEKEELSVDKNNSLTVSNDKLNSVMAHLKQNLGVGKDNKKLEMDRDSLKINPLAITPVSVLVANTSDKNSDAKGNSGEEDEEKAKNNQESSTDSEKVMTIDPKTGFLGPESSKADGEPLAKMANLSNELSPTSVEIKGQSSIKNIPTKVIVREDKTEAVEVKNTEDPIKVPVRNSLKEINLIIPRPNFPSGCESGQSGIRFPVVQPKTDLLLKPNDPSKSNISGSPNIGIPTTNLQSSNNTVQLNLSKPKPFILAQNEIKVEPHDEKDIEGNKNPEISEDKVVDKKHLINFSISKIQDQGEKRDQEESPSTALVTLIKPNPNVDFKHGEKKERKYSEILVQDESQEKDSKPPVLTPNVNFPLNRDSKDNIPPGLLPMGGIHPHLLGSHVPIPTHHYNYPFGNPGRGVYTDKPTITIPSYNQSTNEEPQNLKIKQEVIQTSDNFDPIQNLKDLKVPGQTTPNEPPRNSSFLPGPSIDNIKKEPENFQSKEGRTMSPQIGTGPINNNPAGLALRTEREKEGKDFSGIVKLQEREERDVKPAASEEESHTPPLPPTSRSNVPTPPISSNTE